MRNYWLEKKRQEQVYLHDDFVDLNSYSYQFVQNEVVRWSPGSYWRLGYTPVLENSLVGTIYWDDNAIQTFYVQDDGRFIFYPIGEPFVIARSDGSSIDYRTGEIKLSWGWDWKAPIVANARLPFLSREGTRLVVSYGSETIRRSQ
jgi:hypothetical protein